MYFTNPTATLTVVAILSSSRLIAQEFEIEIIEKEQVNVTRDGGLLARLMISHDTSTQERHHDTYKPYLHVYDAAGILPITKGPGGLYTHHRGIFVGYNKIQFDGKSFDRWHMRGGDQIVRQVSAQQTDAKRASFTAEIEWQGDEKHPLLVEYRRLDFTTPEGPFYLAIELNSALEPVQGTVVLDGDPEHAGAQFRPADNIVAEKTTYLFPGQNTDPHIQRDLAWVAAIFTLENRTFTAVVLNHPDNPTNTAFSAYRDYGRFGAFPRGEAKPGAPLKLRYQWLIAEGEVRDPAVFQNAANVFTQQKHPTPAVTVRTAQNKKSPTKPAPQAKGK